MKKPKNQMKKPQAPKAPNAPKASDLTRAERLLIARRRKRERKDHAAKRWGVSLYEYQRWENGEAEPVARGQQRTAAGAGGGVGASRDAAGRAAPGEPKGRTAPLVAIGSLEFFEWAMVLRRRSGESVKARAKRMGVTPWWLSQMELGEAPDGALRAWMLDGQSEAASASPGETKAASAGAK